MTGFLRRSTIGSSPRLWLSVVLANTMAVRSVQAVSLSPDSLLTYVPNLGGNTFYGVILTLLCLTLFYHTFRTGGKVEKWALCLPIGEMFFALGYWLRIAMRTSQDDEGLYTVMYLFVVLSPAAFLAFNYILFGRFIAALEGEKPSNARGTSHYSFIPPRLVKAIFVTSDVCTFCVQAAGGGMQTSNDYKTVMTGNTVFLAGVSAQGASYILFTALTIVAHARLYVQDPRRFAPWRIRWDEPTVLLLDLLYVSGIGIIVRSVYRIVEMAQGYGGYLYSHEVFTFTLDALPLLIATGVWAICWPGLLVGKIRREHAHEKDAAPLPVATPHDDATPHSTSDAGVEHA